VEDYPFGDEVAVFKVVGRMFALVPLGEEPGSVSLKCDPELAIGLRGRYAGVTPGYHLNKRHWNTVTLDGSVPDEEVLELIDHSYDLVVARLTKAPAGPAHHLTGDSPEDAESGDRIVTDMSANLPAPGAPVDTLAASTALASQLLLVAI
jgi:predicted DNA-binding protein (MmcQ/YjbR family)